MARRKSDREDGPPPHPTTYREPDGRERQTVLVYGLQSIGLAFLLMRRHPGTGAVHLSIEGAKAALLVLLLVLATACAPRLAPPILQEYTAYLTDDGDRVLLSTTVTTIYPFLTWTLPCDREHGLVTIARCSHVRTFRFTDLDRRHHIVIYTEVPTP